MNKIIFFDCDGTIYDNDNSRILESTYKTLEILSKKYTLALCTGRSGAALKEVKHLLHYFDIKILINGNYITYNDEVIFEYSLDKKIVKDFLIYCENNNITVGFVGDNKYAVTKDDIHVRNAFKHFGEDFPIIDRNYYLNNEVYQLWVFGNTHLEEEFTKKFKDLKFMKWQTDGYDIISHLYNKYTAIKFVQEKYNFDQTISIGDGYNDIEMIKYSDIGIAMGNSHPKLKEVADYITDDVDKDGIYKAFLNLGFFD